MFSEDGKSSRIIIDADSREVFADREKPPVDQTGGLKGRKVIY